MISVSDDYGNIFAIYLMFIYKSNVFQVRTNKTVKMIDILTSEEKKTTNHQYIN